MLPMLQAGSLRHRLTILAPAADLAGAAQNAYGEVSAAPHPLGTRWGRIEPLSGRELWQARQVQADVTHKITVRYFKGLAPRHQIQKAFSGGVTRTFNVESVLDVEDVHQYQICLCKEQV